MFRKLVSNLSFSPALITQIGFYAHRLRQEEVTRRLTVIFTVLALVIQSLTILAPSESANASSEQDLIRGGVSSRDDLLLRYDKNTDDIKDIYSTLGLTREEIAKTIEGTVNSKDTLYSVHRNSQYSPEQGETSFSYSKSSGGKGTRYVSPMSLSDTTEQKQQIGSNYRAFIGQSSTLGWFAIITSSASLATKGYPATITPDSATATSLIKKTLSVINITQGASATSQTAQPLDKLSYTLTTQNSGKTIAQAPISLNLTDALEYSTLIDDGGGVLDPTAKTLSWPVTKINPGASEERTFALQIMSQIPSMPTGTSNTSSYDCVMSATFGTNNQINVSCPFIKGVESIIGDLPATGFIANIVFSSTLLAIVTYFYLRTRQMKKEIRLIRHNLNTGTM